MVERGSVTPGQGDIVLPLLAWFGETARDLPWRNTYDPYHVWLSEVMLQQTQMERGVAYFLRWIERFPDVRAVAEADQQEILKYWEGLGYYARARNLHKAAKVIAAEFAGEVPCDYRQLLALPGIGSYTAAAVASIAGNHDVPVIDANVIRVYARLFDLDLPVMEQPGKKRLAAMAGELLPPGRARLFNQALMELGGLVCLPRNPRCPRCPVASSCRALLAGTVAERPVLGRNKRVVPLVRVAGVIRWRGRIFIQQRRDNEVWGGLWEFPGGEPAGEASVAAVPSLILAETALRVRVLAALPTIVHHYTHHKVFLHGFLCELADEQQAEPTLLSAVDYRWTAPAELDRYAFPAGPRKLLAQLRSAAPDLFPETRRGFSRRG
jgi:A/G-specific adenine glycosylase